VRPEAFGPVAGKHDISPRPTTLPLLVPEPTVAAEGVADARS
jgi:hypothetical protein